MVLDRIALMANCWQLPTDIRKLASWVGGVRPGKDGAEPRPYDKNKFPHWADPGNKAYKAMVDELLSVALMHGKDMSSSVVSEGYKTLLCLGLEKTGDCVEAALAGAFAASRFIPE